MKSIGEQVDSVIFTDLESEAIKQSILEPLGFRNAYVRDPSERLISFSIVWHLIRNLRLLFASNFFGNLYPRLRLLYEKSIIEDLNPTLVITFRDNEPMFYELAKLLDNVSFFAIQNSVRFDFDLAAVGKSIFCAEAQHPVTYFSWGTIDFQLQRDYFGFNCNIIPVGSFRTALKNSSSLPNIFKDQDFDICLVSTVTAMSEKDLDRPRLLYPDAVLPGEYDEMNGVIAEHLRRYLEERGLKVVVALRGDSTYEKQFYETRFGSSALLVERKSSEKGEAFNFNTYHAMDSSTVVISLASSAMLEAMAEGKKILQVDYSKAGQYFLSKGWGYWQLSDRSYNAFKEALDIILYKTQSDFDADIREFANLICVFDSSNTMPQLVKESIQQVLKVRSAL